MSDREVLSPAAEAKAFDTEPVASQAGIYDFMVAIATAAGIEINLESEVAWCDAIALRFEQQVDHLPTITVTYEVVLRQAGTRLARPVERRWVEVPRISGAAS